MGRGVKESIYRTNQNQKEMQKPFKNISTTATTTTTTTTTDNNNQQAKRLHHPRLNICKGRSRKTATFE